VTFSRFSDRANIWRFFVFGLIFTGGCYVLLYKIKKRFWRDIFLPIQEGLFNDTPMPIDEFEQVRQKRKIIEEAKERECVLQAVLENKSKVAHNIKSPLRTLRLIQQEVKGVIPQREAKLLESVIDSISNILGNQQVARTSKPDSAKNLHSEAQAREAVLLTDFLEETISQKSAEYARLKGLSISLAQSEIPFGTFVNVVRHEFRAILSNLINNSVEAIAQGTGQIQITTCIENDLVKISVADSGGGVPASAREQIFEKGVSTKENGTGYGLYHARQYLKQWSGAIRCGDGNGDYGAVFEIFLPTAKPPQWFAEKLDLRFKKNIVVFDDDVLIHRLWKDRLQALGHPEARTLHFVSTEAEFEACLEKIAPDVSESLILCDFDLGLPDKTGFDIVRSFGVSSLTTMVTNNFQSQDLIEACGREHICILPKPCIHSVPINA
jgi:signal transduction histidine kinase